MTADRRALPQIIAFGGHSITDIEEDVALSRYLLDQIPEERPRICFLHQGSGEDALYIANFYRHFLQLNAMPSDLSLFRPHTAGIAPFLFEQDIIYVGGGNTKSMLALWREWGVDRILNQVWQRGTVLSGVSAGAICWFEQGLTDSVPGELTVLDCLGFLSGSCSPHFDGEAERRPSYHRLIESGEMKDGYGIDNNVGLHFVGAEISRVVSSRASAQAWRVERSDGGVTESELKASVILRLEDGDGQLTVQTNPSKRAQ